MHEGSVEQALTTFLRHREKLIAKACRIVESRAIAEEFVQDSWLRWHERQYPPQKSQQILRRIVRNLALDWLRRDKEVIDRRLPGEILIFDHNLANATVSDVLDLHDPAPALHVLAATEGARVFSIRPFVTVMLPPR